MNYKTENTIVRKYIKDIERKYSSDLSTRLFRFAINVFGLLRSIVRDKDYDVFRYQLSKSATSIGANYEEAQGAFSKKDFASKIGICLKEARETNYFLRLILELKISDENKCTLLVEESKEIMNILLPFTFYLFTFTFYFLSLLINAYGVYGNSIRNRRNYSRIFCERF